MYDGFSDRLRIVMLRADEEARRLNCSGIGTEHLLLGQMRITAGRGYKVLQSYVGELIDLLDGPVARVIPHEVKRHMYYPRTDHLPDVLPLTPRAKSVLDIARRADDEFQCDYVGTQHLNLGLMLEPEGVGGILLTNFGFRYADLRDRTLVMLETERQTGRFEYLGG